MPGVFSRARDDAHARPMQKSSREGPASLQASVGPGANTTSRLEGSFGNAPPKSVTIHDKVLVCIWSIESAVWVFQTLQHPDGPPVGHGPVGKILCLCGSEGRGRPGGRPGPAAPVEDHPLESFCCTSLVGHRRQPWGDGPVEKNTKAPHHQRCAEIR